MDYDRARDTALRLVTNFGSGRTVTFTRKAPSSYDPLTDTEVPGTPLTATVKGVKVPRSASDISTPYDSGAINRFIKVVVPASGIGAFVPRPGDQVVVPGEADPFIVTDCKPLDPDGDAIAFVVLAERGDTT